MTFRIDVDGTLTEKPSLAALEWAPGAVAYVQALLDAGHRVIVWTARGAEEFGGEANPEFRAAADFVHEKFPTVPVVPKPWADYFLDDRCYQIGAGPHGVTLEWIARTYGVGV